jgi:hypothetical protein
MAEANITRKAPSGTRRLAEAVRAAKISAAQRTDVVVDIREADRARLEMFADELQPIVEAVPAEDDLFDFYLSGGPQPRFWVDGTAHVTMARDRRTYHFARETRLGRVTLCESPELRTVADAVTDYVAERIVERDRAFALIDNAAEGMAARGTARDGWQEPMAAPARPRSAGPAAGLVIAISWLLIGIVLGLAAFAGFAAWRGVPLI